MAKRQSGQSGPDPDRPSLKDPELYDTLREEGASEQKAARVSNAAAARGRSTVGHKGGKAEDLEERTVPQLRQRAKELGLSGYSGLRKAELIKLIRRG